MAEVRQHPLVECDLEEALLFYGRRNEQVARNLKEAARAALDDIARWPRLHAEDAEGFRRQRVARFPYALVYHVEDDDRAYVFVLEHLRRRPGYWHERLNDPLDL